MGIQFGLSNSAEIIGNYHLLRITDIQNNEVNWNTVPFTNIKSEQAEDYLLDIGDILFARTGATVGKSYLVSDLPVQSVFASYLIRVKLLEVDSQFIKYFFESKSYWEQITDKSVGIGQPNVNGTKLKEIILPLPPITEQHRIVTAIESAFTLIDEIDRNKTDLQSAVSAAKSKILSLAIRGKLVPQDPNDEPASVLLDRIRAKREALIKSGKIKRDKGDSVVIRSDDNCYYQKLPDGWALVRLEEVCTVNNGFAFNSKDYKINGIPLIRISNIKNGMVDLTDCVFIEKDNLPENDYYVKNGDLLIAMSGATTGKMGVYNFNHPALLNQRIGNIRITFPDILFDKYKNYAMSIFTETIFDAAYGGAQPNISNKAIELLMLPLPPLAEQHRIVVAIQSAFEQLDSIKSMLA
jgi:type I restriction enzyme S subunit